MPRQFQNDEVQFLFPENWYLSESYQETEGLDFQVMLEHPGGAFWLLSACNTAASAQQLVHAVRQEIDEQYESVEWSSASQTILQHELAGNDAWFFSLDLAIAAEIRTFSLGSHVYVIHAQAESREFEQLRPVFAAIATSLLQASPRPR